VNEEDPEAEKEVVSFFRRGAIGSELGGRH